VFANSQLGGEDFLKLMIQELVNQDPLNPMSNEQLLTQVSNIKNMETLSNLDQTMTNMTFQGEIATAGSLIGKAIKGISTAGENASGIVAKVTASNANGVTLITSTGVEIPIDKVTEIQEVTG
jgi:flagellar basal-body rod modification protein FlgD